MPAQTQARGQVPARGAPLGQGATVGTHNPPAMRGRGAAHTEHSPPRAAEGEEQLFSRTAAPNDFN